MNFVAILNAVIASWSLADVHFADLAHAIRTDRTPQSIGAWIARSTAIGIRLEAIFLAIATRWLGAFAHIAQIALAIGAAGTGQPRGAWLTFRTAAIDVRFLPVFHLIDTGFCHAMVHGADEIRSAIRIERAFDAGAFSVTNHRPHGAFRASRHGLVRGFAGSATRVEGAFFSVIENIGRIDHPVDAIAHTIALVALAVTNDLLQYGRAFGREHRHTCIGNARSFAAFGIRTGTFIFRSTRCRWRYIEAWVGDKIIDTIDEVACGHGARGDEQGGTSQ